MRLVAVHYGNQFPQVTIGSATSSEGITGVLSIALVLVLGELFQKKIRSKIAIDLVVAALMAAPASSRLPA